VPKISVQFDPWAEDLPVAVAQGQSRGVEFARRLGATRSALSPRRSHRRRVEVVVWWVPARDGVRREGRDCSRARDGQYPLEGLRRHLSFEPPSRAARSGPRKLASPRGPPPAGRAGPTCPGPRRLPRNRKRDGRRGEESSGWRTVFPISSPRWSRRSSDSRIRSSPIRPAALHGIRRTGRGHRLPMRAGEVGEREAYVVPGRSPRASTALVGGRIPALRRGQSVGTGNDSHLTKRSAAASSWGDGPNGAHRP
jgi:hypothetical protein